MNLRVEKDNTILILLPTYNRVEGLTRALTSVKNQDYKNWIIALIDDGCIVPAKEIAHQVFDEEDLSRVVFYHTGEDAQTKLDRKNANKEAYDSWDQHAGIFFYPFANTAMNENDFDIGIFLCDDDLLIDGYLRELNRFYKHNPEIMYSYSNCVLFDERTDNWWEARTFIHRFFKIGKVNPAFNLDTTQVSWRSKVFKEDNCKVLETPHSNFDAHFYQLIANIYGSCQPNFLLSQYKNYHKEIFNL